MYSNGDGVEKDLNTAAEWYLKAADQGNAHAQYNVGVMYGNGEGLERSSDKALTYLKMSADQGYEKAIQALDLIVNDLIEQADQGNVQAQRNVGIMYSGGIGVDEDLTIAVKYLKMAADQGDEDAAKRLKSLAEAFLQQAEQGNPAAQYNLGLLYYDGIGVKQDKKKAKE